MKKTLMLFCMFSFTACAPIPMGGEGLTKRGDVLIGEALLGFDGNNVIIITSSKGWACEGTYSKSVAGNSTTRKFPLTCDNGAKGNAVMSVNQIKNRATVAFTLSNKESGSVSFGMVQ